MADRQPSLQTLLSQNPSLTTTNHFPLTRGFYHHASCKESMAVNRKIVALSMKKNQPKNPLKAILAGKFFETNVIKIQLILFAEVSTFE